MSVDLHRISTGISSGNSRNGFGNIVSFPSGSSFPAYGTFNSQLYDITYPIANGGAFVTINSTNYPSQNCDVELKNNGSGGTYTDWATATDVQYFAYGVGFLTNTYNTFVTIDGVQYPTGSATDSYSHDGFGGYYNQLTPSYEQQGVGITTINTTFYVSVTTYFGNGNGNYACGSGSTTYTHDGNGGYTTTGSNSYYSYGSEITQDNVGSDNYTYYHNGSGGYYESYYNYGG